MYNLRVTLVLALSVSLMSFVNSACTSFGFGIYGCDKGLYCPWTGDNWYSLGICEPCPIGHFCEGGKGEYRGPNPTPRPQPCYNGTYSDELQASSCIPCPAMTYSNITGANSSSTCEYCETGKFSFLGAHGCTDDCPYPSLKVTRIDHTVEVSFCEGCASGQFLNASSNTCEPCPEVNGTQLASSNGASECSSSCPAGTYYSGSGSICTPCEAGKFAMSSAMTNATTGCLGECPAGRYSKVAAGATSAVFCSECAPGTYFDSTGAIGSTQCRSCPVGTWSGSGSSVCTVCPSGKSSPEKSVSADQCVICAVGGYYNSTTLSCILCEKGYYTITPGANKCSMCELGTYGDEVGLSYCKKCGVGTYSSLTPTDSCLQCRTGSYCSEIGMTAPTKCPVGRYSSRTGLSNEGQCYICSTGKFNNRTGSVSSIDCTICPPGRYGPQSGLQICTPCPGGKYSAEVKQTSNSNCQECPIHFYSLPGAGECTPCPHGFSTSVQGATSCVSPPLELTNAQKMKGYFTSGIAYIVTLLIAGSFGGFAAFLQSTRSKDARLVPLTTMQTVIKLSFAVISIVSEAFLCGAFYSEGGSSKALGTLVVFFRLLHMIPTLLILSFVFLKYKYFELPPWLDDLRVYRKCFAHDHFLDSIYPYAALSLLACLDSTLIVLLPWQYTQFSFNSIGFPNMFALRYTNFYKIFQDTLRFICNVIYIVFTSDSQNASVSAFLAINMLISVVSIALSFMVAVMKSSALYQIEKNGGTKVTSKRDEHDDVEGNITSTSPLHSKESRDLVIRQWLVLHMPNADSPSIHAVDQAFKRDGILTVGDLADCIQGNVRPVPPL